MVISVEAALKATRHSTTWSEYVLSMLARDRFTISRQGDYQRGREHLLGAQKH